MTELSVFIGKFGTVLGFALFVAYKEIPLILKKRSGRWVDLSRIASDISEIKSAGVSNKGELDKHMKEDKDIQDKINLNLAVLKNVQDVVNQNTHQDLLSINAKLEKLIDYLRK